MSGAEVAVLADLDSGRGSAAADAVGARATEDPFGLVTDPCVDAVVVAPHDATDPEVTGACVAAGRPRPMREAVGPSLAESAELVHGLGLGLGVGLPR